MKYIRNLHNADDRVFSVSPQIGKDERPFLGIIIICNKRKYCVPLSKPKKKHEKMRDKIDFKKIVHNGNLIGVLNFNLMIPVEDALIQCINTKIRKHDNMDTRKKKELLIQELEWCNEHVSDLTNTANVLYQKYISGEKFTARKQCLDFRRMESECKKYYEKAVVKGPHRSRSFHAGLSLCSFSKKSFLFRFRSCCPGRRKNIRFILIISLCVLRRAENRIAGAYLADFQHIPGFQLLCLLCGKHHLAVGNKFCGHLFIIDINTAPVRKVLAVYGKGAIGIFPVTVNISRVNTHLKV